MRWRRSLVYLCNYEIFYVHKKEQECMLHILLTISQQWVRCISRKVSHILSIKLEEWNKEILKRYMTPEKCQSYNIHIHKMIPVVLENEGETVSVIHLLHFVTHF